MSYMAIIKLANRLNAKYGQGQSLTPEDFRGYLGAYMEHYEYFLKIFDNKDIVYDLYNSYSKGGGITYDSNGKHAKAGEKMLGDLLTYINSREEGVKLYQLARLFANDRKFAEFVINPNHTSDGSSSYYAKQLKELKIDGSRAIADDLKGEIKLLYDSYRNSSSSTEKSNRAYNKLMKNAHELSFCFDQINNAVKNINLPPARTTVEDKGKTQSESDFLRRSNPSNWFK